MENDNNIKVLVTKKEVQPSLEKEREKRVIENCKIVVDKALALVIEKLSDPDLKNKEVNSEVLINELNGLMNTANTAFEMYIGLTEYSLDMKL